jgi:hypothetical protein
MICDAKLNKKHYTKQRFNKKLHKINKFNF